MSTPSRRILTITASLLIVLVAAIGSRAVYRMLAPARTASTSVSPSGTGYPFTPEEFRSNIRDWEIDGLDLDALTEKERRWSTVDSEWEEQASFMSLDEPAGVIAEAWLPSVHDAHDLLSPHEQREILNLIAEHAKARSMPTPQQYIELIESDPNSRWKPDLAPLPKYGWSQLTLFYDLFIEKPFDVSQPVQDTLREVWASLAQYDHLYSEVGYGTYGALFQVSRIRSAALLRTSGFSDDPDAPEDIGYWTTAGSRSPMKFSQPTKTVEDVIETHESAVVLRTRIIVRLQDGRLSIWDPIWFLDPDTGRWVTHRMGSRGNNTFITIM